MVYKSLIKESMNDKLTLKENGNMIKRTHEIHEREISNVREEAESEKSQLIKQIDEIHGFYKKKLESVKTSYELSCNQIEELQSEIAQIEVMTKIQKERDENFSKANTDIYNRLKEADVITK